MMMNPLLLIFLANVVDGMKSGLPAYLSEFGYIVSIIDGKSYLCSGVIIDEAHVLTIARVIVIVPLANLGVIAGVISFSAPRSSSYDVEKVYIHPDFKVRHVGPENTYHDNDIALLRLRRKFYWNPLFASAPLENTEYDGDNCLNGILISWKVSIDSRKSITLIWEWIALFNKEVDEQSAQYLGEHEKFFIDVSGKADISRVDLGSPILCGNSITGLVVQGERKMIRGKPSVMISIAPYLAFIRETIRDGLFDVEPTKYPYVASIWYGSTHVCGGFILDATHIATAGHCVAHDIASNFKVAVGYASESIQWLTMADITIDPGFKVESTHQPPAWYIDHDFAIVTLAGIIQWNGGAGPLTLLDSNDFHEGKICELLRWKSDRDVVTGVDVIKLMSSRVVLMDECFRLILDPSTEFQVPSFWGRSQYLMPIADSKDVGNPIICEGNPVGFLIQAVPIPGEISFKVAKFLKIHPYMESSRNMLNQNE